MRRRDFIGIAGGAVVTAGLTGSGTADQDAGVDQEDPRVAEIGRLIEARMAEYRVPGVAFGLWTGDTLFMRGFGITNLDNPQPVTPDTVFPIASITKTVVAMAVLRLVDEGRMDLHTPIRAYLPDFTLADEDAAASVTAWHLLTHTPGWAGQLGTVDRGAETHAYFTASLADHPQVARPGEVWSYNNAGFRVAARILEVMTESAVHEALRDLVFRPLGLDLAFTRTGEAMSYRFAAPHRAAGNGTEVIHSFALPAGIGSGGAAMSLSSLMRYARFHMGDGTVPSGERVLSRSSLELMRTAQFRKAPTTDEMGVGWHLRRLDGVLTAVHCGTLAGHCLHLQLVPDRGLAFAVLTNHREGWRLNSDVERVILDTYAGLALAPGQATGGNRGGNEVMTVHAEPLETQPSSAQYAGTYERAPLPGWVVSSTGDPITVAGAGEDGMAAVPLQFWGPDLAYTAPRPDRTIPYPYRGLPVEFIRDGSGDVRWIRFNGRIARRT